MDAEINNVIYMELYSGPKMAHGKYKKTNIARSIDRDSTVYDSIKLLGWPLQSHTPVSDIFLQLITEKANQDENMNELIVSI
jgi:hypothetical protein